MLNLSINEKKQILGGEYFFVVYDPSGTEYEYERIPFYSRYESKRILN